MDYRPISNKHKQESTSNYTKFAEVLQIIISTKDSLSADTKSFFIPDEILKEECSNWHEEFDLLFNFYINNNSSEANNPGHNAIKKMIKNILHVNITIQSLAELENKLKLRSVDHNDIAIIYRISTAMRNPVIYSDQAIAAFHKELISILKYSRFISPLLSSERTT